PPSSHSIPAASNSLRYTSFKEPASDTKTLHPFFLPSNAAPTPLSPPPKITSDTGARSLSPARVICLSELALTYYLNFNVTIHITTNNTCTIQNLVTIFASL